MSGLADLNLRTDYRKGRDDIAQQFYLPCMSVSTRYDRAVGFFNSAIYVIAWPSLRSFVERQGKMRMICSPVLPPQDIEALETGYSQRVDLENAEKLREEIRYMLSTPYLFKPAAVLASLIALDVVDIRIAFMKKTPGHERLFHDKLGLFHDPFGNTVAFKGSMNETWAGLSADGNLESVDVYLSWEHDREAKRVEENRNYFDQLWQNEYSSGGVSVKAFPEIAREELLSAADTQRWPEILEEICREIEASEHFQARNKPGAKTLRPHQESALTTWERKGRRGILEHATGSGKTFTAISAMRDALNRKEVPLVLVPSELLLTQWHREISDNLADLEPQVLRCGAGFTRWRDDSLLGAWTRSSESQSPRIVLSTMQTGVMPEFRNALRQGQHLFMVADEVHRIGSPNHLNLLSLQTGPRLGLSATPRRAGDPVGTDRIFKYFEDIVPPPFTLHDAIKSNALTPYIYHVHTVTLSEAEQEQWDLVTKRVRRLTAQNASAKTSQPGAEDQIKRLLIERGRILKQAAGKASAAAEIVVGNYEAGQRWIVYCDDLVQMNTVKDRLTERKLPVLEYHSAMAGDKERTLKLFEANGGVVVSIRCLDEGIDIPSVSHALILASSKNPREFVQRRGRVLRRADGKSVAHIYDALVLPLAMEPEEAQDEQREDPRLNILGGELSRAVEFGRWALNPAAISDLERIALQFSKDYQGLLVAGYEDEED